LEDTALRIKRLRVMGIVLAAIAALDTALAIVGFVIHGAATWSHVASAGTSLILALIFWVVFLAATRAR
jgi:hypothetical protein